MDVPPSLEIDESLSEAIESHNMTFPNRERIAKFLFTAFA
jgi:hypothetical protein